MPKALHLRGRVAYPRCQALDQGGRKCHLVVTMAQAASAHLRPLWETGRALHKPVCKRCLVLSGRCLVLISTTKELTNQHACEQPYSICSMSGTYSSGLITHSCQATQAAHV